MATSFQPSPFLRYALVGDALASGATGLLLLGGAGFLTGLLGMPESLMRYAGLFLLPCAAAVAFVGTRETVSTGVIWAIIAVNALWVVESILLLLSGWVSPTLLGTAFVIAQALVVAAFAEAQFIGLHKSRSDMPAGA
ncbi:hypothetical protein MCEMSEM23_00983 [Rhabdaerophilaceae bacterium]